MINTHTMNNYTNTPAAALEVLAEAVAKLEAMRADLQGVVTNYHNNADADYDKTMEAINTKQALDASGMIDALKELQTKVA